MSRHPAPYLPDARLARSEHLLTAPTALARLRVARLLLAGLDEAEGTRWFSPTRRRRCAA